MAARNNYSTSTKRQIESKCAPKYTTPKIFVEQTLAIIKPNAVEHTAEIKDIIFNAGFTVLDKRLVTLSPENASELYSEHSTRTYFATLVGYMSSGPVVALRLAREKAIDNWRKMIGPTNPDNARMAHPHCLRALYGKDQIRNGFHGSYDCRSAVREIQYFFPNSVIEPLKTIEEARDYMAREVHPVLLRALTEMCKVRPRQPLVWLAQWLSKHNANRGQIE